MAAFALPGNLADTLMEGVADAGGGAVLRLAWDRDDNTGMLATGGFILGGLLLPMFAGRGQMIGLLSNAMLHSGSVIAGWITTEKVFQLNQPVSMRPLAGKSPQRALRSGNSPAYNPSPNGARVPQGAVSGRNPNTGDEILGSRI